MNHLASFKTLVLGALNLVEVKASLLMLAFASMTLFFDPQFIKTDLSFVDSFFQMKAKSTVKEVIEQEESSDKVQDKTISINLSNSAFRLNNTYSFKYTSLGFFTKSLDFIEQMQRNEAEQKIAQLLPRNLRVKAKNYIRAVMIICEKYQIDPLWVISVMWTESHFKPFASSSVGAHGLMQLMPSTRKYLYRQLKGKGKNLMVETDDFKIQRFFHLEIRPKYFKKYVKKLVNIELGVLYLKKLLKSFNYNHRYATVAYNMGPGWTHKRLNRNLPVGTKNIYLDKVLRAYKFLVRRI